MDWCTVVHATIEGKMNRGMKSHLDPVVEAYKEGVDMTLVMENLKLTPDQRLQQLQSAVDSYEELVRQRKTFRPLRGSE